MADEGQVRAGPAWATAYTLLGWWTRKYGLADGPFAPMFVYSQLARGKNRPVALADVLAIEQRQGIDTQADYRQGRTDYRHGPTRAERARAQHYRIAGYTCIYARGQSPFSAQTMLKAVLAAGQPVVLGVPVYDSFLAASPSVPFVDVPSRQARPRGAEAVVVVKYDGHGVWVENQWGGGWGLYGYAELSWQFVNRYASEAWVISVGRPAAPALMATPTPAATVQSALSATALMSATPTAVVPCPISAGADLSSLLLYSTSVTASLTNTSSYLTATAVMSVTPTPTAVTPCPATATPYATYAAPSSLDVNAYPTAVTSLPIDTGAYPTAAATYPTDTGLFPTAAAGYPTDLSSYLTSVAAAVTTTTPSPTTTSGVASPTDTPQGTVTPTPLTSTAQVTDTPTSGPAGTAIYLSGTGFGAGNVLIYWNNSPYEFTPTDSNGNFAYTVIAPLTSTVPGTYPIRCVNPSTGADATTTFMVTGPPLTSTPTPTATRVPRTPTPTSVPTTPTPTATAAVATLTPTP